MARPVWTGSLRFGLVSVAVRLYSATEQQQVSFRQFEEGSDKRVRYKRVAEGTDRQVDYDDVVKGYELPEGDYVMLSQEELEAAEPERSRSVEISDFVDLAEIDPVYYEKAYYLGPGSEESEQAYVLLRTALERAQLAGIASFVMRGKEHLAAIRPSGTVLMLQVMHFADEVRDPGDTLERVPAERKVDKRQLDTAMSLIDQLKTEWEPDRYEDTYRERVLQLVERKANGETVQVEPEEEAPRNVIDLTSALQRSVEQAKGGPGDVADQSKQELYRRAGELGVSGRSKMSKGELADAVRKAS